MNELQLHIACMHLITMPREGHHIQRVMSHSSTNLLQNQIQYALKAGTKYRGIRRRPGRESKDSQPWDMSELIKCPLKIRIVGFLLLRQTRNLGVSDNSGKFDAFQISRTVPPNLILRGVTLMRITEGAFWVTKGASSLSPSDQYVECSEWFVLFLPCNISES